MIGTVISADMDLIGQLQPHTPAKFVKVDMNTAMSARHDRETALGKLRDALK
jgi:allophanate hydrolase subunit 2